jgi:hypothetical protein
VILNLGHGVVPTVFWGNQDCQGREFAARIGTAPKALNLITVQPQADQPSAETGADLRDPTPSD